MNPEIIKPDLTTEEAYKLVDIIKSGSDHSGMLIMKSIANTLRYVQYPKVEYEWSLKDKKIKKVNP